MQAHANVNGIPYRIDVITYISIVKKKQVVSYECETFGRKTKESDVIRT